MKTLKLSTGSFDQNNTFTVRIPKTIFGKDYTNNHRASLHQGYEKEDDGVYWVLQSTATIKSSYTEKDCEETYRLKSEEPLVDGEIVMIDNEEYRFKLFGDYSNIGIFEKV